MNQRIKDTINLMLLLFVGAAAGVTLSAWNSHLQRPPPPGARAERFINEFGQELGLDSQQREQVRSIFDQQHRKLEQLRLETDPKFKEIARDTLSQLESILSDQQRVKAGPVLKRLERRSLGLRGPPPGGRPPPGSDDY